MNREIKFRAWDKKTKQWICVGYAPLGEVTLFDVVEQWLLEHNPEKQTMLDRLGGVEETQYTGLKDKNGTEIYEGDIVRFWTSSTKKSRKGIVEEVIYVNGAFFPFWNGQYTEDEQGDSFDGDRGFEVIGNKYQNPELL